MRMVSCLFAVTAMSVMSATFAGESSAVPATPRVVALVVQNHSAPGARIPMAALTDALSARLSDAGFQVINPYNAVGENENRTVAGEALPKTSAVGLAKGLGANGLLTASVIEFLDTTGGNPPVFHQYTVRLAFSLADVATGATVCGETIKVKSPQYSIAQDRANRLEYLGDLLYSAADRCAESLRQKTIDWRPAPLPPAPVPPKETGPITVARHDSPTESRDVPAAAGALTMSDLDAAVKVLVSNMLEDPRFKENYERAVVAISESSGSRLPIAVIGGIEDKTGSAAKDMLAAIGESVRILLFNSSRFDVKDDAVLVTLAKRIVESGNSPLENGELMGSLKQHGSPDFFVTGDLKKFVDFGGRNTYRLRLALHNLTTGKTEWEGIRTIVK